jgi:hypothetical protein
MLVEEYTVLGSYTGLIHSSFTHHRFLIFFVVPDLESDMLML